MRGVNQTDWSKLGPELRRLWTDGVKTDTIAERLGVSRGAVVGYAFRNGFPAHPLARKRNRARHTAIAEAAAAPARPVQATPLPALGPPIEAPPAVGAPSRRLALCQWPMGDPRSSQFRFCAEPATPGKSYCPQHCACAYAGHVWRDRERHHARTGA